MDSRECFVADFTVKHRVVETVYVHVEDASGKKLHAVAGFVGQGNPSHRNEFHFPVFVGDACPDESSEAFDVHHY